jgi:transposase
VHRIPNRKSPPCFLLREKYRESGKQRVRTLANLSHLPVDRIVAIERALRGDFDDIAVTGLEDAGTEQGPQFGGLYALFEIGKQLGLLDALGKDRKGKLALLMVIAHVAGGMSRRAVVRWARTQAVHEVFGLGGPEDGVDFDENTLYEVLDDLSERRFTIESKLFKSGRRSCGRLFLYDVTSSYLEGDCNELAAWGYNRDGKKGKKQIVIGLLTDELGDPVAVDVFKGNTSDPKTVLDQVRLLTERFGARDVVFVGDRGMLKRIPRESINEASYQYITAITKPEVESLLRQDVLQLPLFSDDLGEVEHEGIRYIFRRNPIRAQEMGASRADRLERARALASDLSAALAVSPRKRADVALRKVIEKVEKLRIDGFAVPRLEGRTVCVEIDKEALACASRLDGVYVLKTDTAARELGKEQVHRAYKSLYDVERDFRCMKTDLQIRPVYVRKESRTRGHVLVVMLALILRRELEKRLASCETEVVHSISMLNGWTLLRERLGPINFCRLPKPNAMQQEILDALGLPQPTRLTRGSKTKRRKKA